MLRKIGVSYCVSRDPDIISRADKLILPGVGAFGQGMENLQQMNLIPALEEAVIKNDVPILGICIGMHLFTRGSEEGEGAGLSWIAADSVKFSFEEEKPVKRMKIPHMGWNYVRPSASSKLYSGWEGDKRFYFVHSYHVVCDDPAIVASETQYGHPFTSSVEFGNIFGVQFHPEKSHKFGMELLTRFARI